MRHPEITVLLLLVTTCHALGQGSKEVTTPSGLRYTIEKAGTGQIAKTGDEVAIYETASYPAGKQVYSIEKPASPLKIVLGRHDAIAGVEEGVTGMKVGEIRRLIVPPALSKRKEYPAILSKDSTLIYRIELVGIVNRKE